MVVAAVLGFVCGCLCLLFVVFSVSVGCGLFVCFGLTCLLCVMVVCCLLGCAVLVSPEWLSVVSLLRCCVL